MGTIYNLGFEYIHQNGKSIVFKEKDGEKLSSNHLHNVQLKMMQSNRIPHLLVMSVENIDFSTKLHYNINSKNKVVSFFRNNNTNMNDYYQLFLSIIKTLENSSSYMLNQDNFILRSDFIYVGENASDVYLAYLPIKDLNKQTTINEDMKQLLTDIAGEVEGLQGNEFKSILTYIKNSSFSLSGLKKLLLELISLRTNVNQFQPVDNYTAQSYGNDTSTSNSSGYKTNDNRQKPSMDNIDEVVPISQRKRKMKKQLPPLSSRHKVYIFAISVILIALTWKLFDMYPIPSILWTCIGLTILVLAAVVIYTKFWRPGVTPIDIPLEEKPQEDRKQNYHVKHANSNNDRTNFQPNIGHSSNPFQQQIEEHSPNFSEITTHQSVAASSIDMSFLTPPHTDDTVLLEDESTVAIHPEETVIALLYRTGEDGQRKTIVINNKNFLIGRNNSSVHYTEESTGVSRIHAEILQIDPTSYGLKDLGSKNGTKLNGNALVPYKVYALNDGDEFIIGKARYSFKWSSTE
ncbi:FHA domain-containing protein [Ornithinibacillus massiliensis]|uniref:FHA domain-containing protein n=1 Tax=Ornithinibacillus massiliensis TaxID=1944633 RepID=A0ABS5ME44_9BACI|nr:DUF6382 domain-containing protein [Ornithinibacillus massiliensis]MBS3680353.1 FHA domain-containing protein [Ornithinibacillus massiliensis]